MSTGINIGDKVWLLIGSPEMRVEMIDGDFAGCVWTDDDGIVQRRSRYLTALTTEKPEPIVVYGTTVHDDPDGALVVDFHIDPDAAMAAIRAERDQLRKERDQQHKQLCHCYNLAHGSVATDPMLSETDPEWCLAYFGVLELRRKYDALCAAHTAEWLSRVQLMHVEPGDAVVLSFDEATPHDMIQIFMDGLRPWAEKQGVRAMVALNDRTPDVQIIPPYEESLEQHVERRVLACAARRVLESHTALIVLCRDLDHIRAQVQWLEVAARSRLWSSVRGPEWITQVDDERWERPLLPPSEPNLREQARYCQHSGSGVGFYFVTPEIRPFHAKDARCVNLSGKPVPEALLAAWQASGARLDSLDAVQAILDGALGAGTESE